MSGARVLVLDDEAAIGRALRRLLAPAGFVVTEVQDPQRARDLLASQEFSVIICDEKMPTIRGVEFLEECSRERPLITRVMLTGYADPQIAAEAVNRAEVFRLLWKPWSDAEVVAIVRQAAWKAALSRDEASVPAPADPFVAAR